MRVVQARIEPVVQRGSKSGLRLERPDPLRQRRERRVSLRSLLLQRCRPTIDVSQLGAALVDDTREILTATTARVPRLELRRCRVFGRVLRVIEEAFEARVMRTSKDGAAIDLGPDHYARLVAVGTFMKLLTAGRPVPKAAEPRKDEGLTLADLV